MNTHVLECLEQFLLYDLSRIVDEYLQFAGVLSQKLSGKGYIKSLAVLPGCDMIGSPSRLICGCDDDSIQVWDVTSETHHVLNDHEGQVTVLAALPDNRLVSGSNDRSIRVWDLNSASLAHAIASPAERDLTTETSHVLTHYDEHIRVLVVLPDNRVAVGGDEDIIRVWDLNHVGLTHVIASPVERDLTTRTRQALRGHNGWVWALAVLPNNRLASGSGDQTIRIWDLTTKTSYVLMGHTGWVLALAALPNNRLASGSSDKTIRIWDLTTKTSYVLRGHTHKVTALAALPNNRLASGSYDKTIRIWDLNYVGLAHVIASPAERDVNTRTSYVLTTHTTRVNALVVLSEDNTHTVGSRLVSAFDDSVIQIWE